jgi:hypothetical protein
MVFSGRWRSGLGILVVIAAGGADAGELRPLVVASGRAMIVEGQRSWLEGGFGRLTEGAGERHDAMPAVRGQLHLGVDWTPAETWLIHAHGVLQGEPSASRGQRAGLVEAFLQFRPELTPTTALRFRAGLFFPQTSLENTEPLWQSPYTITLSSFNSWIGEEVRLSGLETSVTLSGDRDRVDLAAAAFVVNDPMGALLGWRGWGLGDRLSTLGEVLPLPPLRSFEPGQAFADQRGDGTVPFDELDSRVGWQARVRWTRFDVFRLQAAVTDNRADRRLYRGQYSWETRFAQAGLEAKLGPNFTLVAEGAVADTGMGPPAPGGPQVQVHSLSGYALVSWSRGTVRLTVRVDGFENDDRDGTAEPNDESGWSWTAAAFWQPKSFLRMGVEYLALTADRPAAAFSGADPDTGARRAQVEMRLRF